MTTEEVYRDIESFFGLVPAFFKRLTDSSLQEEWRLYRRVEVEETAISGKYKQLICLAVAATANCRHCMFYHTEAARALGATEAEIEDALACSGRAHSWSCGKQSARRPVRYVCLQPLPV